MVATGPLALTAPAYLWLSIAVFLPLAAMLYFSFLSVAPLGNRDAQWTLSHYGAFFAKDFYQTLAWRSLRLGFEVTLWCALIGFPAALALARSVRGRWREALFLLIILPFWSNALVRVFSWTMVLRGDGLLERALAVFTPPDAGPLLPDLLFSYPAIVIGLVHAYLPYMILSCYLSLQAIDGALLEAARSLGASPWSVFWRITLPLSLPGLCAGSVLIFVPVIGSFMEPRILGGRDSIFLGTVIEDQFTTVFNWPLGAALSFILLALALAVLAAAYPLLRGRLNGAAA